MAKKILIVDDSDSERLILRDMLSEYDVLTAINGKEAMEKIYSDPLIKLVILDLNMPVMNGFEVLEELKTTEYHKRIRVIIMSDFDEQENEIRGLKLGAVDYIRKPVHQDTLKARIEIHRELQKVQEALEDKFYSQGLTYDKVFNQAPMGIAVSFNCFPSSLEENPYFSINPKYEEVTGRQKEELRKLGWAQITHPDDLQENMNMYNKLLAGEIDGYAMDKRFVHPDGKVVWVHIVVAPLNLSGNQKYKYISLVQDITKRKLAEEALKESERSKSVLLSHIPGMAYRCSFDKDWTMQYVSPGCYDLTGYEAEQFISAKEVSFNRVIAPEYRTLLWERWEEVVKRRTQFSYEYEIITADKTRKWVLEKGQGIYGGNGELEALEGIILDISDRKEMEDHLRYNTEHDRWTGLYNLLYLETLLKSDLQQETQGKKALVGINLSYFYSLNLIYGFHYTQELIKKVADTLSLYGNEDRILFKMHENQFAFYIRSYNKREELELFCKDLSLMLNTLLMLDRIDIGMGVVEIDDYKELDTDQLFKSLLIASERSISSFDDFTVSYFDHEMERELIREDEIKRELVQISEDMNPHRLFLKYQPILDLATGRIVGFEALARLNSDGFGMVAPDEFIPIAEKSKLIIPLGDRIILMALDFAGKLKNEGYDTLSISINISGIQMLKEGFADHVIKMIQISAIRPELITLEVTESVFAGNFDEINRVLGKLQELGVLIAIDDFGTGYSSFSREGELNADILKIDKSFIDKVMILDCEDIIIGDIITMAHRLKHRVVAEGVEHEEQRTYLEEKGCDKIQGYLISKPLHEQEVMNLLKEK